jgi:hypothetical protein
MDKVGVVMPGEVVSKLPAYNSITGVPMDQLKETMPLLITGEELEGCWHALALWYPEHIRLLHVEVRVNDDRLRPLKPQELAPLPPTHASKRRPRFIQLSIHECRNVKCS